MSWPLFICGNGPKSPATVPRAVTLLVVRSMANTGRENENRAPRDRLEGEQEVTGRSGRRGGARFSSFRVFRPPTPVRRTPQSTQVARGAAVPLRRSGTPESSVTQAHPAVNGPPYDLRRRFSEFSQRTTSVFGGFSLQVGGCHPLDRPRSRLDPLNPCTCHVALHHRREQRRTLPYREAKGGPDTTRPAIPQPSHHLILVSWCSWPMAGAPDSRSLLLR